MTEAAELPIEPWLPGRNLTEADLARTPDDGHRYEIVDGSLLMSPPPSIGHQLLAGRVRDLLAPALPPDLVALEGVGIRMPRSVLIPDVTVGRIDVALTAATLYDAVDVALVVEVVSDSSVTTDRVTKPALYAAAGIASYWRIERDHPDGLLVAVHALHGDVYKQVAEVIGDGEARIEAPFPITIRPSALLARR